LVSRYVPSSIEVFSRSPTKIPIFIIAGLAVWFNVRYTVPSNPASGSATPVAKQTPFQLIKRIDWVGTILLAAWVGAALVAVSLNTNSTTVDAYPWTSPTILGLFGASAVLFVVFLFVELKWAAEPVMPFELLHRRTPMAVALNNFILSVSLFGCVSIPAKANHFIPLTPRCTLSHCTTLP
jgi:hypothetical protein